MTRKKRNKIFLITGILSILIGLIYSTTLFIENFKIDNANNDNISNYLKETSITNVRTLNTSSISSSDTNDESENQYIAVLEVPKINLIRGLVNSNSKDNNVNSNIQILNGFTSPSIKGSNLVLASHSGNSKISFFKYLYKLKTNDEIILYYNGNKFFYKIDKVYKTAKNGTIKEKRDTSKTTITLTTCDKDKSKQLVIVAYQYKVGDY